MCVLKVNNLISGYSKNNNILKGINLHIEPQEIVAIIGKNGSGKSTFAKSILNMVPFISGEIIFHGKGIGFLQTNEIVKKGLNHFLQGGRIFPSLTVKENLLMAGNNLAKNDFKERLEKLEYYFEFLAGENSNRLNEVGTNLSGGEKHQLALAMILITRPNFLILDEPTAGLSPDNFAKIYEILKLVQSQEKMSMLLIEQNVNMAVKFSDRICKLQNGKIEMEKNTSFFENSEQVINFFFN